MASEDFKKHYHESYLQKKAKSGMKFFPDVIYKDTLVMFSLFILMVLLATFVGVAGEPKADPSDSAYVPRPEWYFLFLFQMLKYFPGKVEWIGTFIIPSIAIGVLLLLPFLDRNPFRYFGKRKIAISIMTVIVIGIVALTLLAVASTPAQEETSALASTLPEQILAGGDLYSVNCVECHGSDGEGGEIKGVEGLEGFMMKAIHSQDEMYTRSDETFFNIISYGQPNLGMQPFGKAFGGELGPSDIDNLVAFMRYTWDDRAEIPQEVTQAAALPQLAENEVPSYEVHIAPLVKRYCISCHRPGKKNNNYYMADYNSVMTTGDHTPNVIGGDLNSNMILMIHRQEIEAGGPMPPTKALPAEVVSIFERWVAGGAPDTAADAAKASPGAVPAPGSVAPSGTLTTTVPLTNTLPLTTPLPLTSTVPLTGTVSPAPTAIPGTAKPTP